MVRQEQVKHILCKDFNITPSIHKKELSQDVWRKYLNTFKTSRMKIQHLWLEHHSCKSIIK